MAILPFETQTWNMVRGPDIGQFLFSDMISIFDDEAETENCGKLLLFPAGSRTGRNSMFCNWDLSIVFHCCTGIFIWSDFARSFWHGKTCIFRWWISRKMYAGLEQVCTVTEQHFFQNWRETKHYSNWKLPCTYSRTQFCPYFWTCIFFINYDTYCITYL